MYIYNPSFYSAPLLSNIIISPITPLLSLTFIFPPLSHIHTQQDTPLLLFLIQNTKKHLHTPKKNTLHTWG